MVRAIMDEIHRLGGWVTNPQPLQDDRLRFEVLDDQRGAVLAKLGSWDWRAMLPLAQPIRDVVCLSPGPPRPRRVWLGRYSHRQGFTGAFATIVTAR